MKKQHPVFSLFNHACSSIKSHPNKDHGSRICYCMMKKQYLATSCRVLARTLKMGAQNGAS